jgi:hypothetical protein
LASPPYGSGTYYNATTGSYFNQAMAPKVIVVHCQSASMDAIEKWQHNLGFAPCKPILKTLANTTHQQLHPTIKMSHNGIWFPICFNFNITN